MKTILLAIAIQANPGYKPVLQPLPKPIITRNELFIIVILSAISFNLGCEIGKGVK